MSVVVESKPRVTWRRVAIPAEHGGWNLTLEPIILGLMAAFSTPGLFIGMAMLLAFVARTPLKIVLMDLLRSRVYERTYVASKFVAIELSLCIVLMLIAGAMSSGEFWPFLLIAIPLGVLQVWFDAHAHGRRFLPELVGSIAVSSSVAMIVLADGGSARLAFGLWMLLIARAVASITFVRVELDRSKQRPFSFQSVANATGAAISLCALAYALSSRVVLGCLAVMSLLLAQFIWSRQKPVVAKTLGIRQGVAGVCVVVLAAIGVWV